MTATEITFVKPPWYHHCQTCDYNHADYRNGRSWTWLCVLVPFQQRAFLTEEPIDQDPPY